MKNIQKTLGLILLFPPLLSVLLFSINLIIKDAGKIITLNNLSPNWSGWAGYDTGSGAGFTSATPVYFGLMAIAGALLLKDSKENKG